MPITHTKKRSLSIQLYALGFLALAIALSSAATFAQEPNYLVEVVVFENLSESNKATSGGIYHPQLTSSIGLSSDEAASLGFALLDEAFALEQAVQQIRNSDKYRLLKHFAWRQPGLDANSARAIRINIGDSIPIYLPEDTTPYETFIPASLRPLPTQSRQINTTKVSGSLKLRLGRFLHLDTKLVFTDAEKQKSYRLSQSRKMRSNEFHYIDNPRFGLLVKILPLKDASN